MPHSLVVMLCYGIKIRVKKMPVFEPNDYFWKNHWDGKEEKWVAYARAVREIIAKEGGFGISNLTA